MARSYQYDRAMAWRERIRRFGRSGLTVVRFCEQEMSRPEAIRIYRARERRDRASRKQLHRSRRRATAGTFS